MRFRFCPFQNRVDFDCGRILLLQLDASLMSALLCLTSVSVFLQINFLLKTVAMTAAGVAHVVVYFGYVGPLSAGEDFRFKDGDEMR